MVLGLTHAGFSAYWALGGRWLLGTVGEWAVRMALGGGYDRAAMIGHVALWDPLFALWGLALLSSLWLSRRVGDR